MRRRSRLRLAALAAVVLASAFPAFWSACGGSARRRADKVTLQLNWFHEAEFIGYYVADAKGFYDANELSVDILEGGPGDPAVDHLLDGTADFAISSFGEQKDLVAEKRPAVAVMAAFQIPPLVIFSLSESGIRKPADLVGRRVGVTTDYWKDVLDETLKAAGVDASKVAEVEVKAEDLQALYDHRVDAWLGYAQDEPIQAEMAGHHVTHDLPRGLRSRRLRGPGARQREHDQERSRPGAALRARKPAADGATRWSTPTKRRRYSSSGPRKPGLEFQKLAVRAVGPLVDTPQAPIGWIDARTLATADGVRLRSRPPGLHHELLGVRALTGSASLAGPRS